MRLSVRRAMLALLTPAVVAAGAIVILSRTEHEGCGARVEHEADSCGRNVPENETADLMRISAQRTAVAAAPGRRVPPGAYAAGARPAARRAAAKPALGHDGRPGAPGGKGPLHSGGKDHTGVHRPGPPHPAGPPPGF